MFLHVILYILSFIAIWLGAGLIIQSIDRVAKKLHMSSFAISFFLLGLLTSIPEIGIGLTAIAQDRPQIFVGTLLGGSIVIFLFIIPFLAILGKGIRLMHGLESRNIFLTLMVIVFPGLLLIDRGLSIIEGSLLILSYSVLLYSIQRKKGIFDREKVKIIKLNVYSLVDLARVALGMAIVFLSSQYIVNQTIQFSTLFGIPTFYLGLIVLSMGTNLPELSIAVRAVLSGKKDVAFGDYLGSAAANTLLFGIFTFMSGGEVVPEDSFLQTLLFLIVGLGLFFYFSRSQRNISRSEGIVLMSFYALFILFEVLRGIVD